MTLPVAVVISGRGSNMEAIARAAQGPDSHYRVARVIADRPTAGGLARAAALGVPTSVVPVKEFADRATFEAALSEEFEGPVHSGIADARIESFDKTVKLFCTEVVTCLQEDVENAIAFCALLKALFPQIIRENSLRFA